MRQLFILTPLSCATIPVLGQDTRSLPQSRSTESHIFPGTSPTRNSLPLKSTFEATVGGDSLQRSDTTCHLTNFYCPNILFYLSTCLLSTAISGLFVRVFVR